jgi:hypothetical protein
LKENVEKLQTANKAGSLAGIVVKIRSSYSPEADAAFAFQALIKAILCNRNVYPTFQ